jgi:protein-S-isoprenylcysteine O-methyltransferase Ste14
MAGRSKIANEHQYSVRPINPECVRHYIAEAVRDPFEPRIARTAPRITGPQPTLMIAHIFLAIYLIIVGLTVLFGLSIPSWVAGTAALIAGVLLLANYVGLNFNKKGR